jgi:hypothetical protein
LSLFWRSRWVFFVSIEQQKRDFTSEIWASRMMMKRKKKLKSWIVGKKAIRKNYWVNFVFLHCEKQCSKISGFRAEKIKFFVHTDVHVDVQKIQRFLN